MTVDDKKILASYYLLTVHCRFSHESGPDPGHLNTSPISFRLSFHHIISHFLFVIFPFILIIFPAYLSDCYFLWLLDIFYGIYIFQNILFKIHMSEYHFWNISFMRWHTFDYPQDCPPQNCPLGGNPEVGNSESISHQDCPPQLLCFLWIVCARYGPWVNAGDYASVFNHNILKNKVIHAITGDIWKRSVERSQTNVPNETLQAI